MPEISTKISVHAHPGARRNEITGLREGVWELKVAAPPVDGKANVKLVKYLAEVLDVPKSAIIILSGESGRKKVIEIHGLTPEEITRRFFGSS